MFLLKPFELFLLPFTQLNTHTKEIPNITINLGNTNKYLKLYRILLLYNKYVYLDNHHCPQDSWEKNLENILCKYSKSC